ncbi:hypothetical protein BT63DRAFT_460614 [Microthyrium microscopicum]|uniref:Uncharacterized protein n=1 Tax=Microthyrium microscopicum TaxID=703497 RepID=A0A6A6TX53_9PEZI|nr:hypothetical protein BT63DRAFT_460614 [Microthyrium microscopicum]
MTLLAARLTLADGLDVPQPLTPLITNTLAFISYRSSKAMKITVTSTHDVDIDVGGLKKRDSVQRRRRQHHSREACHSLRAGFVTSQSRRITRIWTRLEKKEKMQAKSRDLSPSAGVMENRRFCSVDTSTTRKLHRKYQLLGKKSSIGCPIVKETEVKLAIPLIQRRAVAIIPAQTTTPAPSFHDPQNMSSCFILIKRQVFILPEVRTSVNRGAYVCPFQPCPSTPIRPALAWLSICPDALALLYTS